MKCLFLTDLESPDYGEGLLWQGLVNVLGAGNVYDYPIKPSFHSGYMEQVPYGPFGWMQEGTPPAWDLIEPLSLRSVKQHIKDGVYDFVVGGSMRGEPIENVKELYPLCTEKGIPVAMYDGWDGSHIEEWIFPYCDMYLKRELPAPHDNPKVRHYPFSIPDGILKSEEQWLSDRKKAEIDVLFIMGNSHSKRVEMYYAIKEWMGSGKAKLRWEAYLTGSVDRALPYPEYLALLDNSRFAISLVGGGQDTMRFWEILGRTGLIHDSPNLQILNGDSPVGHGGPALPEHIEKGILSHPTLFEAMALHTFRKANLHTSTQRARNLIGWITGEVY